MAESERIPILVVRDRVGGDLTEVLKLSVKAVLQEQQGLSFNEKLALVQQDLIRAEAVEFPFHQKSVTILEQLKTEKLINDWVPVKKNSLLDDLQADYIVVTNGLEAVCLQMVSSAPHAQARRKKIRRMFYDGAIAVVNFKTWGLELKSDEQVKKNILAAVSSETLIGVNVYYD